MGYQKRSTKLDAVRVCLACQENGWDKRSHDAQCREYIGQRAWAQRALKLFTGPAPLPWDQAPVPAAPDYTDWTPGAHRCRGTQEPARGFEPADAGPAAAWCAAFYATLAKPGVVVAFRRALNRTQPQPTQEVA